MRMVLPTRGNLGFLGALLYLTGVSVSFFIAGAISNHSFNFWYLSWNLFLAWLPVVFALWLIKTLDHHAWSSLRGLGITLLWLGFLPNSFYIVSDFIHLQDYQRIDLVYDTVMFSSFVLTGLLLGYTSLYMVHKQLMRRLSRKGAWGIIAGVMFICSFAIYLGRDLRWNTWDVLINPAGILFDTSDVIAHPSIHYLALTTTCTFFLFLMSFYIAAWQLVRTLRISTDQNS